MRALAITALGLALAACGGSANPKPLTAAQVKHCSVRVFLAHHATHAQETAVGGKLRKDPRVARVVFTTKQQALAEMKKKYPGLFKAVRFPMNPLPDSYTAVPENLSDASQIAASVAHAAGVDTVKTGLPSRCHS